MKRRSFLSLSGISVVSVSVVRAADEQPDAHWHETIRNNVLAFKAVSEEGSLVLQVGLFRVPEAEVSDLHDENGEHRGFRYKGKKMPYPFFPGCTMLNRFDFTWDGKVTPIPERFWDDLPDLRIETSTLDPKSLEPDLQWQAQDFLSKLNQPRLILSADGGTALIEWVRSEECGGRSTIRWIISKSGTVLRHRHCPPHGC